MRYIKQTYTNKLIISKSVFITLIYPLDDLEDIKKLLDDTRANYPKADHFCSASLYGINAQHATANDDGEPSRTAGVPMLAVLKHHGITNILCIVIRYFGGIKLGAGGLVRAYTKAVSSTIEQFTFYNITSVPSFEISFEYKIINQINHYLKEIAEIKKKVFLKTVTYTIVFNKIDASSFDKIKHLLLSYTVLPNQTMWIKETD